MEHSQRRFTLLIGIDFYKNDGSRKTPENGPVTIKSLTGCVNDVEDVKGLLRDEFKLDDPIVLTSSPSATDSSAQPKESEDRWPTFKNIEREFDAVYSQAKPGDLFFFHYSGHGKRLTRIEASPAGCKEDPSLLTMDFGCGEPAVRGWQLNVWLRRLNEKRVQVIAILDSCYSGGSWRGHRVRTIQDEVLNGPKDEVLQPALTEQTNRNAEVERAWSINPEGFTLMAACKDNQKAEENDGRGAFTHELLQYLQKFPPSKGPSTYRLICDKIAWQLKQKKLNQDPEVFGRDRLVFFGNYEPFLIAPLVCPIDGNTITIPMGKAHGVKPGTEFKSFSSPTDVVFVVDSGGFSPNRPWECRASIPSGHLPNSHQHSLEVVPSKWSLGSETFQVFVDSLLGADFREVLYERLKELLKGSIKVIEHSTPGTDVFKLIKKGKNGVDICGPRELIGYEGPLRCLDLKSDNLHQLATEASVALGHLARFKQIKELINEAEKRPAPFKASFSKGADSLIKFTFRNTDQRDLYVTVLDMTPGFGVRQLWPTDRPHKLVKIGATAFRFGLSIPEELRGDPGASHKVSHRDIIRTIVTTTKEFSWRSLELPDIWQPAQMKSAASGGLGRGPSIVSGIARWWMEDTTQEVTEV